jgi:hypothetical protein
MENVPLNHHYVSQCQIKNFFNVSEGKIFLYDKEIENFYFQKSTKRVFSEEISNSRLIENEIDHKSLELDLKLNFEDSFISSINIILTSLEKEDYSNPDFDKALINLTRLAVIGEIRLSRSKKKSVQMILTAFNAIAGGLIVIFEVKLII